MSRILSLAVAVTFLGCTGLALAQQPDSYSYRHRSFSGNTTEMMPSRDTGRSANRSFSGSTTEMTPIRDAGRGANQFASENEARSRCGNDTVVWVNTKTRRQRRLWAYQAWGVHLSGGCGSGRFIPCCKEREGTLYPVDGRRKGGSRGTRSVYLMLTGLKHPPAGVVR